ncbi:MAG: signal peptidase I [Pseudomonadota bacterium]
MVRGSLQLLWFVITPLAMSGVIVRYLTPYSVTAGGFESAFARFTHEHTLLFTLALFVSLVALFRYWRAFLPGGRYLFVLPPRLVERVPRRRLALCEAAFAELVWLSSVDGKRALARAAPAIALQIDGAAEELHTQLFTGKWSRVERALQDFQNSKKSLPRAGKSKQALVFALTAGVAVLLALAVRLRFFQAYEVLGSSMLPAFTPGELLLGKVVAYSPANLPQRGEVVVLRVSVDGEVREIIKRVLGLPGDHIAMLGDVPVINGWALPYCDAGPYFSPQDESANTGDPSGRLLMEFVGSEAYPTYQTVFAQPFAEYVVKPGEVFVLGDNRSNSRDSRNFDGGAAHGFPLSAIRAKVTRALFSRTMRGQFDPASVWQPLNFSFRLEGTDMSMDENAARRCLVLRPKDAQPPSPQKLTLASTPR